MTKAAIWKNLKAIGYNSQQLKDELNVTYAQVTKEQLQSILEGRGVNENLGSQCGGVTEVTKDSSDSSIDKLPLTTKFNWSQNNYPSDDDTAVYMEIGDSYHRIEKVTKQRIKDVVTGYQYKVKDLSNQMYYGCPLVTTYKGIPVEHVDSNWKIKTRISDLNSVNIESWLAGEFVVTTGDQKVFYIDLKEAVEIAKNHLSTEQEQINLSILNNELHPYAAVLGGSTNSPEPGSLVLSPSNNFKPVKPQLTPKLQLFSSIVEWCYLMQCYSYLLGLNENVSELNTLIQNTWFTVIYTITNSYLNQPLPSVNDYLKLLQLNRQQLTLV